MGFATVLLQMILVSAGFNNIIHVKTFVVFKLDRRNAACDPSLLTLATGNVLRRMPTPFIPVVMQLADPDDLLFFPPWPVVIVRCGDVVNQFYCYS